MPILTCSPNCLGRGQPRLRRIACGPLLAVLTDDRNRIIRISHANWNINSPIVLNDLAAATLAKLPVLSAVWRYYHHDDLDILGLGLTLNAVDRTEEAAWVEETDAIGLLTKDQNT